MKLNVRTLLFTLLALTLAGLFAAWLMSATEWATRDVWEPAQGEAARDPHFLLKRLSARLGAQVEVRHQLSQLPPEGGTLLLETTNWRFVPDREAALRAWVERGGHLVVYQQVAGSVGTGVAIGGWLPVTFERANRSSSSAAAASAPEGSSPSGDEDTDEDDEDDEDYGEEDEPASSTSAPDTAASAAASHAGGAKAERHRLPCSPLVEPAQQPGWFGAPRSYDICSRGEPILKTDVRPLWSVADEKGLRASRMALGKGTITLSTRWQAPRFAVLHDEDSALLTAAILQLRSGQQIWILDDTRHPGLFATLWRVAPAACALVVLGLLLVLWRWSIRFAPLRAPDTLARRSITSQVRGTAAYLLRHGPAALHRAQLRALEEAALAHVPGWRRLSAERRAALLARHAELPATELEQACNPATPGDPRAVGRALGLMEAARRRIAELGLRSKEPAAARAAPPPPAPPSPTPASPPTTPHSPPPAEISRKTRP